MLRKTRHLIDFIALDTVIDRYSRKTIYEHIMEQLNDLPIIIIVWIVINTAIVPDARFKNLNQWNKCRFEK